MRPIDGDLIVRCAELGQMQYGKGNHPRMYLDWPQLKHIVEKCPTLDMAPVQHGRWISVDREPWDFILGFYYCSECRMVNQYDGHSGDQTNYCPHCGAKMDLEDQT